MNITKENLIRLIAEAKESELEKGKKVEREHEKTYNKIKAYYEKHGELPPKETVFKWIASDHLDEHKDYYTKLLNAGL